MLILAYMIKATKNVLFKMYNVLYYNRFAAMQMVEECIYVRDMDIILKWTSEQYVNKWKGRSADWKCRGWN